jgi:hypothetical protein
MMSGLSPNPDPTPDGPDRDTTSAFRTYGIFSAAALEFGLSIAAGLYGGQWLDKRFGTDLLFIVTGVLLGSAAGFYLLYLALMKNKRDNDE